MFSYVFKRLALGLIATSSISIAAIGCSSSQGASDDTDMSRAPISGYQADALNTHNKYRALHGAPAMQWDDGLAQSAQSWANNCVFQHSGSGENLAGGYPSVTAAIDAWYAEKAQYSYNNPGFSSATGHFTQVVWKSSTRLGCGQAQCSFGRYDVCHYGPPGNVLGQFQDNVFPEGTQGGGQQPGGGGQQPGGGGQQPGGGGQQPGGGGQQCVDTNQNCAYWASVGECQRNPAYMLPYCCASCNAAGGGGGQQCTDSNQNCAYWASVGECQRNPGYMLTSCCASCNGG